MAEEVVGNEDWTGFSREGPVVGEVEDPTRYDVASGVADKMEAKCGKSADRTVHSALTSIGSPTPEPPGKVDTANETEIQSNAVALSILGLKIPPPPPPPGPGTFGKSSTNLGFDLTVVLRRALIKSWSEVRVAECKRKGREDSRA